MSARLVAGAGAVALAILARRSAAQAEVRPWGSVEGIRVEGQIVPFTAALCTVSPTGEVRARAAKESQRPRFTRDGSTRTVTTRLGALAATAVFTDSGQSVSIRARFAADSGRSSDAGALCLALPRHDWAGGQVTVMGGGAVRRYTLTAADSAQPRALRGSATGIIVEGSGRRVELRFDPSDVAVVRARGRRGGRDEYLLAVTILPAPVAAKASGEKRFHLAASGPVDHSPVAVSLDLEHPGPRFDGMGGNFRVENTPDDPPVVAYNLANLRVAWGRVEIPWRAWQPNEGDDPSRLPPDSLAPQVRRAMEMARTLAQRGIPFVASVWFPPRWAVIGELPDARPDTGARGNPLDPAKVERIYASLGSYLLYLKRGYGAEPALFSFNESDLGIDVRQTPAEHDAFIKGFGAWLTAHGLATKMLVGDVSDATPTWFIGAAMADTAAWRFVGAVSYHSWRGWSDSLLGFWGDAARTLGKPLLVAEGSIDAGAYRYPQVFLEPWYALEEARVYLRVLSLSRPASIMPWELTSDYSLLAGGGVFGDSSSALHPTERFFVVKQLASVPPNAFHVPVHCGRAETTCAALADAANGIYVVHLVNDGASRPATITGLPAEVRELRVWVTDASRGMAEQPRIPVQGGAARFTLDATSFTTLVGTR